MKNERQQKPVPNTCRNADLYFEDSMKRISHDLENIPILGLVLAFGYIVNTSCPNQD
jgi:hypothetical protein